MLIRLKLTRLELVVPPLKSNQAESHRRCGSFFRLGQRIFRPSPLSSGEQLAPVEAAAAVPDLVRRLSKIRSNMSAEIPVESEPELLSHQPTDEERIACRLWSICQMLWNEHSPTGLASQTSKHSKKTTIPSSRTRLTHFAGSSKTRFQFRIAIRGSNVALKHSRRRTQRVRKPSLKTSMWWQ